MVGHCVSNSLANCSGKQVLCTVFATFLKFQTDWLKIRRDGQTDMTGRQDRPEIKPRAEVERGEGRGTGSPALPLVAKPGSGAWVL